MSDFEHKNPLTKLNLHEPEVSADDEETIWLLSYADLMTLLFTLFVMLYSSLMMDEGEKLRQTLSTFMQGNGSSNTDSKQFSDLQKSISQRVKDEELLNGLQFVASSNGLTVTFSSNLFFDSGSALLSAKAEETLNQMAKVILEKSPGAKIRVEGHTDDTPIGKSSRFVSNWELSGARAGYIISLFEKNGFNAKDLVAVGYGDSRPVQPNRLPSGEKDAEGQRQNRRVILSIFNSSSDSAEK